jgi:UDP-N-acetylglucosamine--N-acetylmuramyl-(pentapeptide) pyrophosphoryl-undecaprenol N-acetylglucosamine transferase
MLKLLLTGGGTAGHVMPNIALIEYLRSTQDVQICYVGSTSGIEKRLIENIKVDYKGIITGKLHRYFTWRNLIMPFQVMIGILQSLWICYRFKPTVLFSKGGFVALPIVFAAWLYRVPIVVHESDITPGLANRLSFPLAKRICTSFAQSNLSYTHKTSYTGLPVREALLKGDAEQGRNFLNFHQMKPILLVWGGSLGALNLNKTIFRLLVPLTEQFQIVHLCGPNKLNIAPHSVSGYRTFEYLELPTLSHVLAAADLVLSRAGATAIHELLRLRKPHILFPLGRGASRGEQIHNARYMESLGYSTVIYPDQWNDHSVLMTLDKCCKNLVNMRKALEKFEQVNSTEMIYTQLLNI